MTVNGGLLRLSYGVYNRPRCRRSLWAARLQFISDAIDAVEKQIKLVIGKNHHLRQRVERVKSIVGFGMLAAAAVMSQLLSHNCEIGWRPSQRTLLEDIGNAEYFQQ